MGGREEARRIGGGEVGAVGCGEGERGEESGIAVVMAGEDGRRRRGAGKRDGEVMN